MMRAAIFVTITLTFGCGNNGSDRTGIVEDPSNGNPGISGAPSEMTTPVGEHDGYQLVSCDDTEDGTTSWMLEGLGSQYFQTTGPESRVGYQQLSQNILLPVANEIDSSVSFGGVSRSCNEPADFTTTFSISDWGEVDFVIQALGEALAERDLANTILVEVTPPIVVLSL